ncbi:MAG: hypothetical protein NC393_03885 [Clostridium sp.]|nr:hypothetical protein [Clostridium sp.]MCM1171248.1 hypothetical protein [Clostridium sp.]MCM1207539.1 hypothetical protein [Ruminococcus sp.]
MDYEKIKALALQYGTPAYVFFEDILSDLTEKIRRSLPNDIGLCFAMKANPFLAERLSHMTDRLEVCSQGEYEICIRENIAPERLVVSGVSKTEEAMKRILSYSQGKGFYTIESPMQYKLLKDCAGNIGVRLKVFLRLSAKNQFGMDRETLERVLCELIADGVLELAGIHYYAGTQKKLDKVEKELAMLTEYAKYLTGTYGIADMELEYGPGLGISYFEGENSLGQNDIAALGRLLKKVSGYRSITIELGRFLTAECGVFLTRIMDIKKSDGMGYIIVDGGIHQINYYGQLMGMKKPYIKLLKLSGEQGDASITKWTICGSLCTANDVLVRGAAQEDYAVGDVLVFERCGAYSVTEGMALFLSRELPQVVLVGTDGCVEVLRNKMEINILNSKTEDK